MKANNGNSIDLTNLFNLLSEKERDTIEPDDFSEAELGQDENIKKLAYEQLEENDIEGLRVRDENNSKLVESFIDYYNKKTTQNLALKKSFFWMFMLFLYFIIISVPSALFFVLLIGKLEDTASIIVFASSFLSIVTAIIVIPKIMARYLFSTKEDKVIAQLVMKIQDIDEETRKLHKK